MDSGLCNVCLDVRDQRGLKSKYASQVCTEMVLEFTSSGQDYVRLGVSKLDGVPDRAGNFLVCGPRCNRYAWLRSKYVVYHSGKSTV